MSGALKDPWNRGAAARATMVEDNKIGTRKSDHVFDKDLKHESIFVLKAGPGSRINIRGADNAVVAAAIILKAVHEVKELEEHLNRHGFELVADTDVRSGFHLRADGVPVRLVNPNVTSAPNGLVALNRAFRAAIRTSSELQRQLNQRGITPIVE